MVFLEREAYLKGGTLSDIDFLCLSLIADCCDLKYEFSFRKSFHHEVTCVV